MAAGGEDITKMIDFLAGRARLRPDAAPVNPETAVPNGPPPISQDPWFSMLGGETKQVSGKPVYIWATNQAGKRVRVDGPFANEIEAQRNLRDMYHSPSAKALNLTVGPE